MQEWLQEMINSSDDRMSGYYGHTQKPRNVENEGKQDGGEDVGCEEARQTNLAGSE